MVAVIVVLFTTTTFVAAALPNVTVAPGAKFVPVIVTAVPPAVDPVFGLTPLTVGATTYVYPFVRLPLCEPRLVTVTVTAPRCHRRRRRDRRAVHHHHVRRRRASERHRRPRREVRPVIVTEVPPDVDPVFGLTLLTVGGTMLGIPRFVRLPL